jgi:hypothetical protein
MSSRIRIVKLTEPLVGRGYERARATDDRERALRVVAGAMSALLLGWAIFVSTATPIDQTGHALATRFFWPGVGGAVLFFYCFPLAARARGWRSASRPRDVWWRSVVLVFGPVALAQSVAPSSVWLYVNSIALTLLIGAGIALERRS